MWTIPHHGRLGGIVGMYYFSQMSWPVGLFVFSQIPNHLHNCLMRPLHQPIHLGVVRYGLQLLHALEFTHLVNDATHKVSTPITQEPGQGPKHWDVTLIQELDNSFSCLIGSLICPYVLHEMALEHQDWPTLGSLLSSRVISMLVKSKCKRSIRAVATIGCSGALDKLPSCCKQSDQDLMACYIWLAIPGHQKHSCNKDKVWSWP